MRLMVRDAARPPAYGFAAAVMRRGGGAMAAIYRPLTMTFYELINHTVRSGHGAGCIFIDYSMIRKSGYRLSATIMLRPRVTGILRRRSTIEVRRRRRCEAFEC